MSERPARRRSAAAVSETEEGCVRIAWLTEGELLEVREVGAKAAHLSRLARIHLVPPGFVITAVQMAGELPPRLEADVRQAYRDLVARTRFRDVPVAVRSSAIDEDSAGASFAGQHDTYLNVRGEDSVYAAVLRCLHSAESAGALTYREQHGLETDRPEIAVLVQQMIESDVSAVAFSANPISGDATEVMVTSAWGLGESVVGGTVTPDTYVIRRPAMRIGQRWLAEKEVMTVFAEGGTIEVGVPADLRAASSLTDSQIIDIARLAAKLERAMGWPADVECAYAYGELYLLQCRPITTMS
jgi:phosphoenolpyruvate synthase/pyruvate phosphate dikinase